MSTRHRFLIAILLAYAVLALLYAQQVPAWQAPDEPAHFNYVHELASTGQFPILRQGDYNQAYLEQLTTEEFPPQLSVASVRYEAHQPPLYYLLAAGIFRATNGSLLALRLWSAALGALLVLLVYAIGRLVFPRHASLALAAAAFTAFLPMHVAMAASVNNDALAEVMLAAIVWASIRLLRHGLDSDETTPWREALLLGVLLGLALVTKVSAYVGIPVALAAPLWVWWNQRRRSRGTARFPWRSLALIVGPALLLSLPWYVRNAQVYGHGDILGRRWHDLVVVGQLRTADFVARLGMDDLAQRFLVWTHDSFWGVFGWLGAWMDNRVYTALLAFSLAVAAGAGAALLRRQRVDSGARSGGLSSLARASAFQRGALGLLALATLGTVAIYLSYNALFVQTQGRYLFPALPAISLAVAIGWRQVVQRRAAARVAAGLVLLAALAAAGWGWAQQGDVNGWSVGILAVVGLALAGWSWLPASLRRSLAGVVFALPFAGLALVTLYALFGVILPQLGA